VVTPELENRNQRWPARSGGPGPCVPHRGGRAGGRVL